MRIILSPGALADLQEIGDFIAQDNLSAAASFVARIKARCSELASFPNSGKKRDTIRAGYRSVTEGDYLIFYRVLDNSLEVMHVLHGRRDWPKLFEQE